MAAPPTTDERGTPATPAVQFQNEIFDARTAELGATTEVERARLAGVDRSTLYRYRYGKTVPLMPEAMRFAKTVGLTVADLWQEPQP